MLYKASAGTGSLSAAEKQICTITCFMFMGIITSKIALCCRTYLSSETAERVAMQCYDYEWRN